MKKCSDIELWFTAYLDGLLSTPESQIVEEHLSSCQDCLRKLEELQRTRAILAGLDEIEPPPGLTKRVMDSIREQEERKGFFRRFFLPLHVKIPVQALAMLLVVVLSVYIYRSTLSEMGNFEEPSSAPQVAETRSVPVKKHIPPAEPAAPGKRQLSSRQAEVQKKEGARPPAQAPVSGVADRVPSEQKDGNASVGSAPAEERALAPERRADEILSSPKAAAPPDTGWLKTRSMAARKEKSQAQEPAGVPPLRAVASDPRSHITMIAENPLEASVRVKTMLRSLGGTGIEEKTGDDIAVVSGRIDTAVLGELKSRLKEIAAVDEPRSFFVSGPKSAHIEITIKRTMDGPAGIPGDR